MQHATVSSHRTYYVSSDRLPSGDDCIERGRAQPNRGARHPAADDVVEPVLDVLRKRIVATKEMVTGEERLRENLTDLYGNVVFYDGRPSQMELDRTDAIGHELSDVPAAFDAWSAKDLAALNTELAAKNLKPVVVMTRAAWEGGKASGQ